jgi:ribosomal protein S18 acetylase RimI-like enzyme
MPLPIIQSNGEPTTSDLLRYFCRAQLHWARHVAEEAVLDVGTALSNGELPGVGIANCVMDAALPEGVTAAVGIEQVAEHFASAQSQCVEWRLNPSAALDHTQPLAEELLRQGYLREVEEVMYLKSYPSTAIHEVKGLKIIPGRASFKHVRVLAEQMAGMGSNSAVADEKMLHLDDSHTDALVALRGTEAAAYTAVLAVGEIGAIQELYVNNAMRGEGIGRTMMSRALEICARSLFKHVFAGVLPGNQGAIELLRKCGFRKVAESACYRLAGN